MAAASFPRSRAAGSHRLIQDVLRRADRAIRCAFYEIDFGLAVVAEGLFGFILKYAGRVYFDNLFDSLLTMPRFKVSCRGREPGAGSRPRVAPGLGQPRAGRTEPEPW